MDMFRLILDEKGIEYKYLLTDEGYVIAWKSDSLGFRALLPHEGWQPWTDARVIGYVRILNAEKDLSSFTLDPAEGLSPIILHKQGGVTIDPYGRPITSVERIDLTNVE